MKPFSVDVSVLLLFFNRADHFSQVWEEVRKARPSRLFLYQDGPRRAPLTTSPKGEEDDDWDPTTSKDWKGILECRELVKDENIDWECEVHRKYQTQNYGCDPSEFISQRWAFSMTDKCIVLEDDDVPSQSFFPFCKEMLDRYEDDERVTMITGFNTDEESPLPTSPKGEEGKPPVISEDTTLGKKPKTEDTTLGKKPKTEVASYFFTRAFSIWGWASWARVVNNWDGEYGFVRDSKKWELLEKKTREYKQRKEMLTLCKQHAEEGKEFYETIFWAYMMMNDGLAIMPRVNMINNIGLDGGTHYATQLELQPKRLRRQFEMRRLELTFPLTHPKEIVEDTGYQKRWYLRNAWNNPWRKVQYSIEELWLNLKVGNWENIISSIKKRIKKSF